MATKMRRSWGSLSAARRRVPLTDSSTRRSPGIFHHHFSALALHTPGAFSWENDTNHLAVRVAPMKKPRQPNSPPST